LARISSAEGCEAERAYLESLFQDKTGALSRLGFRLVRPDAPEADLLIELLVSWEQEAALGDILISRTPLVPQEDMLAQRTSAALAACLDKRETVVPLEALGPPYTALRVDGLALGDAGYPLTRTVGVRLSSAEGRPRSIQKKLLTLQRALESAEKPLVQTTEIAWIAAGGDLMLDPSAVTRLLREGPQAVFGQTAPMLAQADLALVNLEGVVSARGKRVKKSFNFRFDPKTARALRDAGIDGVLHANNHVYDYGGAAFLDSLFYLAQAGIGAAGAGTTGEAAAKPLVFQRRGLAFQVFGLASFPREMNGWDGLSAAAGPDTPGMLHAGRRGGEMLKARFAPDDPKRPVVDIVLFHGGAEWSRSPNAATRDLYTDLIRSGADLVIGSHPHVIQGFEWVLGKPVFWSLGNYMFGGSENTEGGEEGLFIRLGFAGLKLVYLEPFALSLSPERTDLAPPELLEGFYERSRKLRKQAETPGGDT
jgi:poly-gamma-glutamate synthesis protein (capsule biosynthesis protein)